MDNKADATSCSRDSPRDEESTGITSFLRGGVFQETDVDSLESLVSEVDAGRKAVFEIPIGAIVEILDSLGKALLKDEKLSQEEGLPFLSMWLRKRALLEMIDLNLGGRPELLDGPVKLKEGRYLRAQPRGVVAHWIAGNVPTLSAFSLFQSVLCKNANIVRAPKGGVALLIEILKKLDGISVEYEGKTYSGGTLLKGICVIHFPSSDTSLNAALSVSADCKVAWGGSEAMEAIRNLPQREHCETIIFGPKYSFGVIDKETLEEGGAYLARTLESFCGSAIVFDQAGCSSPHVIFLEKNEKPLAETVRGLSEAFKKLSSRHPKGNISQSTAARIINKRAEYYLDPDKDVVCSEENDWTLLVGGVPRLEDPVQSRTLFVKEVDSLMDVVPLITKKVQTIGIAIKSGKKMLAFSDAASYRGVARLVKPEEMSYYDSPWDGMLVMGRLVRFVSFSKGAGELKGTD
jgi:hypothetical protein